MTAIEDIARDLVNMDSDRATLHQAMVAEVRAMWEQKVPVAELARQAGVRRATIYAWLELGSSRP